MSRATVEVAWLDLLAILRISGSSSGFALVFTPHGPRGASSRVRQGDTPLGSAVQRPERWFVGVIALR